MQHQAHLKRSRGREIFLSVYSAGLVLILFSGITSGILVYYGVLNRNVHIGLGVFVISIAILYHILNSPISSLNLLSVLLLIGTLWSGFSNIESKKGSSLHIVASALAVLVSALTCVVNLRYYIRQLYRGKG
jgi:1,4-dihydroxy-2-naphthoate octaprenyltransferase